EVLNCKVAGRSRAAHKWIAIEGQCCFRRGQDAGEILVLLVEHFLNFLFHDGMSARWFAGRKPPVMGVVFVVWIVEKFAKGLAECEARACEEAGKQTERRPLPIDRRGVAHMKNHPCRDGGCGILPERSCGLSSPVRTSMFAMFCASETSRSVNRRISASG